MNSLVRVVRSPVTRGAITIFFITISGFRRLMLHLRANQQTPQHAHTLDIQNNLDFDLFSSDSNIPVFCKG